MKSSNNRYELTPEALKKIRCSALAVGGMSSRELRCPVCGRLLGVCYSDLSGHYGQKCPKCGNVFVVDTLKFRRARKSIA